MIKVGIKKVDEPIKFIEMEDSLENLQKFVGGYIEMFTLGELQENNIDIILDDEGKLKGLEVNVVIADKSNNEIIEMIVGDVIFSSYDGYGNTVGLTDEQCAYLKVALNSTEVTLMNKETFEVIEKPALLV